MVRELCFSGIDVCKYHIILLKGTAFCSLTCQSMVCIRLCSQYLILTYTVFENMLLSSVDSKYIFIQVYFALSVDSTACALAIKLHTLNVHCNVLSSRNLTDLIWSPYITYFFSYSVNSFT